MNEVVQLNTEHSLNCPKHQQKLEGGKHQVELDVEGAWARIVHAVEYDGVSPPQTEGQNASIVGRTLRSMKENPKWAKMAAQAARKAGKFQAQSVVSYQGAEKQACESGQPSAKTHISRTSRDKLEDRLSCAEILDPVEMKHTAANSTYPELPLAEITNLAIVDRHISSTLTYPPNQDTSAGAILSSPCVDPNRLSCTTAKLSPKPIARNKPCPCGSSKKFKKCCGKEQKELEAPPRTSKPEISHSKCLHNEPTHCSAGSEVVEAEACGARGTDNEKEGAKSIKGVNIYENAVEDLEDETTINDTQVDGAGGNGPACSKITYVADEAHMEMECRTRVVSLWVRYALLLESKTSMKSASLV